MKKILFKITSCILGVVLLIGTFGCTEEQIEASVAIDSGSGLIYQGTHIYTAEDFTSEDYFIKDGKSDYKIVIPKKSSNHDVIAVEEFNCLLNNAAGVKLPFVYDDAAIYAQDAKFISIGDTSVAEGAEIVYDKIALGYDGARIITKGKSIFLFGGDDGGVVNAVYTFMQIYFNYEFYYRDCIEIDTNVKNAKLKNFDVTDIPDIPGRCYIHNGYGGIEYNSPNEFDVYAYGEDAAVHVKNRKIRHKFNDGHKNVLLPIYEEFDNPSSYGETIHNSFNYVTKEQARPGWYSTLGEQICYSGSSHVDYFDEENFNALAQFCADKIANSLKIFPREKYPQYNVVSLTQEDTGGFCDCKTCKEWKKQDNNCLSGGMIRLNNAIMKKLKAWMALPENEPYRRDDLNLVFFAYNSSEACPAKYNEETKQYEPLHSDVKMDEGTGVWYACQSNMYYEYSINDSINDIGREFLEKWTDMADYTMIWTYGYWYKQDKYFHDSLSFYNSSAYQYFASQGVDYIYDETAGRNPVLSNYLFLKQYIESKLMWDSSLDQNELINNYMNAMYKDAAGSMKELLTDYRMHFANMLVDTGAKGSPAYTKSTDNYKYSDFVRWLDHIDDALADIEKYKETDNNLYLLLKHRIDIEAISPLMCVLDLYGGSRGTPPFDIAKKNEYKNRLRLIGYDHPTYLYTNESSLIDFVDSIQ